MKKSGLFGTTSFIKCTFWKLERNDYVIKHYAQIKIRSNSPHTAKHQLQYRVSLKSRIIIFGIMSLHFNILCTSSEKPYRHTDASKMILCCKSVSTVSVQRSVGTILSTTLQSIIPDGAKMHRLRHISAITVLRSVLTSVGTYVLE